MTDLWRSVGGRYERTLQRGTEPVERYDFVHQRPDRWAFQAVDTDARVVVSDRVVGLHHPDGWTARVRGKVANRVPDLLSFDAAAQPVMLEDLGEEVWEGRSVRRIRWQRTDRDLNGQMMTDVDTGIVVFWENEQGTTERILGLRVEETDADLAGDDLFTAPVTRERVGHLDLHDLSSEGRGVLVAWSVRLPGLPDVTGDVEDLPTIEAAVAWAREHARTATVVRDGVRYSALDE